MPRWTKEADYRRGRSVVTALHVHLVFVTKYRRGVLSDRCFPVLRETAAAVCHDFGAILKEFDGEDDHVHLLVEYPATVAISHLVNSLKGVMSRRLRQQHFPEVRAKLWGDHLWSPSYFAASCGGAPLSVIAEYVRGQRVAEHQKTRLSRP
jgi:putative transposase